MNDRIIQARLQSNYPTYGNHKNNCFTNRKISRRKSRNSEGDLATIVKSVRWWSAICCHLNYYKNDEPDELINVHFIINCVLFYVCTLHFYRAIYCNILQYIYCNIMGTIKYLFIDGFLTRGPQYIAIYSTDINYRIICIGKNC